VIQLLQAAEEESDAGIEEAYAEGYKAGRIDAAELWKPVVLEEQNRAKEAEDKLSHATKNLLISFLVGIASGAVSTWAIVWIAGR
jgi:flagellar biosynthesis/type III secretory pathway protein FliH